MGALAGRPPVAGRLVGKRSDLGLEARCEPPGVLALAVVSTASTLNSDGTRHYSASANRALSKQSVEYLRGMKAPVPLYGEAVVNKGESFLFSNGKRSGSK